MTEKAPLLHIYIPTYNRLEELRTQLRSLTSQVDERVRVFVNDNCSTTFDIFELAALFQKSGFLFSRNATNVGANANISFAYPLAGNARYLWILSDNDILKPDAVQQVLTLLEKEPDLLIFGKTPEDRDTLEPKGTGWVETCPGLISEAVYRTELFLPQALSAFLYHNSSFPHLAVYYATKQTHTMRVLYSSTQLFVIEESLGGAKGNYGLSIAGMPQLVFLFPEDQDRRRFLRTWLHDVGRRHYSLKNPSLNVAFFMTRKLLWQYIPYSTSLFFLIGFFLPLIDLFQRALKSLRAGLKKVLSLLRAPKA